MWKVMAEKPLTGWWTHDNQPKWYMKMSCGSENVMLHCKLI